jgi:YD repeat-containing protein
MKHICFALLLTLSLFSCQDHLAPLTPDSCQLAAIDRGNGNKHTYTYDASGRVSQMTRDFDGTGSGKISRYVYTFTFDAAGLLTKSTWTLDGKPAGSETYAYTTGRISKVTYANADGSSGTNAIKYNPAGQITEFTYDDGDPANFFRGYFDYNADGITTKLGYDDGQGNVFYEVMYKPVGKVTVPEALLTKRGLPYDVLTGVSWQTAIGGIGSTYEEFAPDDKTGKLISVGTGKTTVVKTNANLYLTESTILDNTNTSTTQVFTLAGCN